MSYVSNVPRFFFTFYVISRVVVGRREIDFSLLIVAPSFMMNEVSHPHPPTRRLFLIKPVVWVGVSVDHKFERKVAPPRFTCSKSSKVKANKQQSWYTKCDGERLLAYRFPF